ncbi:MAG: sodium-dependent bicarbonate transport family permease [Sulfuritalea sp.]|nr:sodium-dependent bicarbonate transport family permease [Sulfuritalea sp.]
MIAGFTQNLLDPAILFFVLGAFIGAIRSNLEIPPAIAKFLSIYLLMALGLKGGAELATKGLPAEGLLAILAAVLMATLVPAYSFLILRRRVDAYDAAAIAATYGSVSAVTFIASQQFLRNHGVEFGGYMTVAMVVMESPAIVMAVLLASYVRSKGGAGQSPAKAGPSGLPPLSMKHVLHEAFTDGAHLLLIGSLLVGFAVGEHGKTMMAPFTADIFKGLLALFLLEMGLMVGRQIFESKVRIDKSLIAFALLMPMVNATVALALAWLFDLSRGDATLLAALSASASYIVVPAIVRYAIPEARPGIYFTMSIAITFPFNILFGIPLYFAVTGMLWN